MLGLIQMNIDENALQSVKDYPMQVGKLYDTDYVYVYLRDNDQEFIFQDNTEPEAGITFVVLTEPMQYCEKYSKLISYRIKVLTTDGIIGWMHPVHFKKCRLIES